MDGEAWSREQLIAAVHRQAPGSDPLLLLETALALAAHAGEAADQAVDHFVGAAREAGLSWTVIGQRLGISKQAARQKYADRIAPAAITGGEQATVAPALGACLQAAGQAADAEGSVPGTQHLLLGLLHTGAAAAVLDQAGVTRDKIRQASARLFEATTLTGPDGHQHRTVGDGAADTALAIAHQIAARRGQSQVRTEHLLWELAANEAGAARRVLDDLGADIALIKKELNQLIPPSPRRRRRKVRKGTCDQRDRECAFCGCTDPARPMVAGPGVWICADCVALATGILATGDRAMRPG